MPDQTVVIALLNDLHKQVLKKPEGSMVRVTHPTTDESAEVYRPPMEEVVSDSGETIMVYPSLCASNPLLALSLEDYARFYEESGDYFARHVPVVSDQTFNETRRLLTLHEDYNRYDQVTGELMKTLIGSKATAFWLNGVIFPGMDGSPDCEEYKFMRTSYSTFLFGEENRNSRVLAIYDRAIAELETRGQDYEERDIARLMWQDDDAEVLEQIADDMRKRMGPVSVSKVCGRLVNYGRALRESE